MSLTAYSTQTTRPANSSLKKKTNFGPINKDIIVVLNSLK